MRKSSVAPVARCLTITLVAWGATGINMMLAKGVIGVSTLTGLPGFLRIVAMALGILLVLPTAVYAAPPGRVTQVSPADGAIMFPPLRS